MNNLARSKKEESASLFTSGLNYIVEELDIVRNVSNEVFLGKMNVPSTNYYYNRRALYIT